MSELLTAVIAVVLTFLLTTLFTYAGIQDDCSALGKFRVFAKVYICQPEKR